MDGPEVGREAERLKILITGGGGFIGSHLSEELLERGYEVFVLEPGGTTKVRHLIGHPRFRVVRDSVMDVSILDSLIAQVDIVFTWRRSSASSITLAIRIRCSTSM